jgi:hypothetical protein
MSQSQTPFTTSTMPLELPDLSNPKAFDLWRVAILRGSSEELMQAVELLKQIDTALGYLRAAMSLTVKDSEQSQALASRALMSNDQTIHLIAKAQLANLHARKAWSGSDKPQFDAQATPLVLEEILREMKTSRERSPLSVEGELRVHLMLADAYTLNQDFSRTRINAAEAIILAQALGMESYVLVANYQLANATYYEGNAATAAALFKRVSDDPATDPILSEHANWARIVAFEALGDDDGIELILSQIVVENGTPDWANKAAIQLQTLRYPGIELKDETLKGLENFTAAITKIYCLILKALMTSPEEASVAREHYRAAYLETQRFTQPALGWLRLELQTLAGFSLLQMGESGLALQRIPSMDDIAKLPPAKRAFALCVLVEILERALPDGAESLADTLRRAAECFADFDERILTQVVARLQVLTPVALALLGRFPGVPDAVIQASNQIIINLIARPITVYDTAGMRPIQAVKYILQAFNIDTDFLGRSGGGQSQALRQVLFRRYHQQESWYRPVTAAQVNFAMLCCRDAIQDNRTRLLLQRAIKDLRIQNGYVPKLQKLEQPEELNLIQVTLEKFEKSLITARAASLSLFGQGGVL